MQWFFVILILPYFCLFLWIYINILKIKSFVPCKNQKLFVSVVVACRNEEKNLPVLLNDISMQDYSPDSFELVVIDDNSSDRTFALASEFKEIRNIKVIKNEGNGKKQAIRSGVNASSADLIITTDADCRMGRGWINTIASFFEERRPALVIGQVILMNKPGFFNRFQELEFMGLQGVTAGTAVAGDPVLCNGANLAFTKNTYNKHSDNLHFELNSGDDIFLLHSLKKEPGSKIIWLESENSVVSTPSSENPGSFLKQRARWLSKVSAYNDRFTLVISIVTFVTILLQCSVLITGIFIPGLLLVYLEIFLIKSIPDFLILQNTTARYARRGLMKWFIPSQIVYPFYVFSVVCWSFFSSEKSKFSSPSPKGT